MINKTSSAAAGRGASAAGGSCGHNSIDKPRQRKKGKSQEVKPERERPKARSKPHMEGGQRHQACDGEQKAKSHPDQDHNQTRPNQPAREGGSERGSERAQHTPGFESGDLSGANHFLEQGPEGKHVHPNPVRGKRGERECEGGGGRRTRGRCTDKTSQKGTSRDMQSKSMQVEFRQVKSSHHPRIISVHFMTRCTHFGTRHSGSLTRSIAIWAKYVFEAGVGWNPY